MHLAGGAHSVSVSSTVTFPSQPTTGTLTFQPLGGNGFIAPHSQYLLSMSVAGDAGGGVVTLKANMDPRYAALIQLISAESSSAAQADGYRFAIAAKDSALFLTNVGLMQYSAWESGNRITWNPGALMDPDYLNFTCVNQDATEVYKLYAIVYNFDINAPQRVPLPQLFASLPRASSAI